MDTVRVEGHIHDLDIIEDKENNYDSVFFKVTDRSEHSVLKGMPCYMITKNNITKALKQLDLEKEYCIEGTLCCDNGKADLQVHVIYENPHKIYS